MDYQRIYAAFIADRRANEQTVQLLDMTERHHILPRTLGGDDSPGNLIRLTPEDHFFAHLLLAKIHGGKMWYALRSMCWGLRGLRAQSESYLLRRRKVYAAVRRGCSQEDSARIAQGLFHTQAPEARARNSARMKALGQEGRLWMQSEEGRARRSNHAKVSGTVARLHTPEARAKASANRKEKGLLGEHPSQRPETRARMKAVIAAKATYASLYGIPYMRVTKAMVIEAGIPIGS